MKIRRKSWEPGSYLVVVAGKLGEFIPNKNAVIILDTMGNDLSPDGWEYLKDDKTEGSK